MLAVTGLGTLALGATLAAYLLSRPYVRAVCDTGLKTHDWARHLTYFGRSLFVLYMPESTPILGRFDRIFWAAIATALVIGVPRLARAGRWDRLALIVGVIGSVAALHVAGGAEILGARTYRYAACLIVPTAIAFACLVERLAPGTDPGPSAVLPRPRIAVLLLVFGWMSLACTKWYWFDAQSRLSGESIWTIRPDAPNPHRRVLEIIARDAARSAAERRGLGRVIFAHDWWVYAPLQYLAMARGDVQVIFIDGSLSDPRALNPLLHEIGGFATYAVGYWGGPMDRTLGFPNVQGDGRWEVRFASGDPYLSISRLGPVPLAARGPAEGDAPTVGR
jgi:hypothetical protein